MLSPSSSDNDDNDLNIIDLLYHLCKENEIGECQSILPYIDNISIINKIQNSSDSTYWHVACYYGHQHMVPLLLEYEVLHSIKNLRDSLKSYGETFINHIKQLFIEHRKLFSNNNFDYDYIEWSVVGDDLLRKRHEFRQAIDLYKTYDNHQFVSKSLAELIHYYLNEYLINENNDNSHSEDQVTSKQIETIEAYFKEAIEKQDYLTYFIKTYTLTNVFNHVLNKHLALYILQYFDKTKDFSSNYRSVNCLIHIVRLLIYHRNLPQYRYQGLCYYGMRITQNDLDQYLSNQYILNRSFLSTSIDRKVAEMFASESQQFKMRHTPKDYCALQYSCLCQYLIKQNSTAINIQSLSTRSNEKEILILPFTVFKVIAIKRNYLDNPTASISIEIELEECEDPKDNKNESDNCETSRTSSLSSTIDSNKDVEEHQKFKPRKRCLYIIIGFLVFAILLALTLTFIFIFVIQKDSTKKTTNMVTSTDMTTLTTKNNCIDNDTFLEERSCWNARPYKSRENLKTFPVTNIVPHQISGYNSMMNHQNCIKSIKQIQNDSLDKLKWDDIGYNFILCGDNDDQQQIYTGRGWNFAGAHCKTYNTKSLGCSDILERSSWNARPYKSREILKTLPVTHIVVHQIAGYNSIMNHQNCIKSIKQIQDDYLDTLKYDDIGYNFILCGDNDDQQQIYTGRGWNITGAHCKNYNTKSLGIWIIGNYADIKSLKAFKSLIQCGIMKNYIMKSFTLVGHFNSENIYKYYLEYFKNDNDLQYSNQASKEQFWCAR
ncbi:unnamed protein product [Rotaria sordida]|uniref:Peptidoglycan recognition protein family domain-containing protein n=1 Tax=Rotaria sordida TaxID=392033 RepID=A0A814S862_9BILA|nr:unnamed protein product [Rotaria sordida]CAF3694420.1 unnamed protein product [Rotaria sordida]